MAIAKFIKEEKIILLIVALAFLARLINIKYGLPYFLIGDEQSIVYGALKMIELKTLIPAFYPEAFSPMYYPPLMAYIYLLVLAPVLIFNYLIGGFFNLSDFKDYLVINPTVVWTTVRLISAVFGVITVAVVYKTAKLLFDKKTALLSSLFISLSFLHVSLSHFARHWVPAVFFVSLIVYYSIKIYKNNKLKDFIFLGVAAGLGFGVSYITCLGLIVFFCVLFVANGGFAKNIKSKKIWIALAIFLLLASVFILLHPQEFVKIIFGSDSGAKSAKSLTALIFSFGYHLKNILNFEPLLFIFSLLSFALLSRRFRKILLLLFGLPVFYIIIIYLFFHNEVRYTVFIIPTLCIAAGFGLNYFISKLPNRILKVIFLVLIFSYPLFLVAKYDMLQTKTDTRIEAINWINSNIINGSRIVSDLPNVKITPNKNSILNQKEISQESLRVYENTLLGLEDKNYPNPSFYVLPMYFIGDKIGEDVYNYLKANRYEYYIMQYWQPDDIDISKKSLLNKLELIKEFSPFKNNIFLEDINGNFLSPSWKIFYADRPGPRVSVYKIK